MKTCIRIVLAGECNVGKSSIITSFLKESFDTEVASILPEITIPSEMTTEKVQMLIIDTSGLEVERQRVAEELRLCDVICLVYSVIDDSSLSALRSYWMPLIRQVLEMRNEIVPVILVGNKIDELHRDPDQFVNQKIVPFMNEYKEIETSIECSAKNLMNIPEVFYYATKAVIYPSFPLYDSIENSFKQKAYEALRRIFTICDNNRNGLLDDDELNAFQRYVFGSPLQVQELEGIKQVVVENLKEGVIDGNLSEKGFIFLHLLFVQRGRIETIWTVLKKFGYDEDVKLSEEYLNPKIQVPPNHFVELSPKAFQFLTELFQLYDKDKDGHLSQRDLEDLFSITPGFPWDSTSINFASAGYFNNGDMSLHQYYGIWSMITLFDHRITLTYLAYLGYYHVNYSSTSASEALKIISITSRQGKKNFHSRTVFLGLVFGALGSGKSEFIKGHAELNFLTKYQPESKAFVGVNSLDVEGFEKYLILEEIKTENSFNVLRNPEKLSHADFLCFLYDTSDPSSFSYLMSLRKYFDLDSYAVVFIGTKEDNGEKKQNVELQPNEYTKSLGLPIPLKISMKKENQVIKEEVYSALIGVAMNPTTAKPQNTAVSQQRFRIILGLSFVLGAATIGGIIAYRMMRVKQALISN